jgi:hypothetical protein
MPMRGAGADTDSTSESAGIENHLHNSEPAAESFKTYTVSACGYDFNTDAARHFFP